MVEVIDTPDRNVFVTIFIRRLPLKRGFEVRILLLGQSGAPAIARRPQLLDVMRDLAHLGVSKGLAERAVDRLKESTECVLKEMLVERGRVETFRTSAR